MNKNNNPLKDVFFSVKDNILFTVERRTDEGVARDDACGIEYEKLCKALLRAGKDENYQPMFVNGEGENVFAQVVNPRQTKYQRANKVITAGLCVKDMNLLPAGGFGCLDSMISQHPTGWDHPYYVMDMVNARVIPGRSNFVWGYPEAVREQGIDVPVDYTWQDMVAGKGANGPWNWTLLEVFPSGETREILKVSEVPGSLTRLACSKTETS